MHSLAFVLLESLSTDIEDAVAHLLLGSQARPRHPYPTFEARCSCVGRKAWNAGFTSFDQSERGRALKEQLTTVRKANDGERERAILRDRYFAAAEITRARDDFEQFDPNCEMCHGSGAYSQSRDPANHTDWWALGGRWTSLFSSHGIADGDVAPVRDVLGKLTPAVVVTPEGDWYDGDSQVASGFLEKEEEPRLAQKRRQRWECEVAELLQHHNDCVAVVVDCHF